jgi:predicted nucleic acid-binding protein
MKPMNVANVFFDTNVLLYLLSSDSRKADCAEQALSEGGHLSVQVLNEFANVATRKLNFSWPEVEEFLLQVRSVCTVAPLTIDTHQRGLELAARYRLALYDAMIVASALTLQCTTLFSEDMQHGQVFDGHLKLCNPFDRGG